MSFRIEHRIGVAAPAPVVWEVLADLANWRDWNPLYPEVQGALRIGERLTLTERLKGQDQTVTATVVDWVPNEQILWRATALGGFVKRLRFLELESLSENGCIFSNGELWQGRYAGFAVGDRRRAYHDAFAALGEALKERAEAAWAAKSPEERAEIERYAGPLPETEPLPKAPVPPKISASMIRRK
jgi:hypothetical protein